MFPDRKLPAFTATPSHVLYGSPEFQPEGGLFSQGLYGKDAFWFFDVLSLSPPLTNYFLYFKALKSFHWL